MDDAAWQAGRRSFLLFFSSRVSLCSFSRLGEGIIIEIRRGVVGEGGENMAWHQTQTQNRRPDSPCDRHPISIGGLGHVISHPPIARLCFVVARAQLVRKSGAWANPGVLLLALAAGFLTIVT
jgi:hypothetical protein